jgi:hypothetical protein
MNKRGIGRRRKGRETNLILGATVNATTSPRAFTNKTKLMRASTKAHQYPLTG